MDEIRVTEHELRAMSSAELEAVERMRALPGVTVWREFPSGTIVLRREAQVPCITTASPPAQTRQPHG